MSRAEQNLVAVEVEDLNVPRALLDHIKNIFVVDPHQEGCRTLEDHPHVAGQDWDVDVEPPKWKEQRLHSLAHERQ